MATISAPVKHVLIICHSTATCTRFTDALTGAGFLIHTRRSTAEAAARESEYKSLDMAIIHCPSDPHRASHTHAYATRLRTRYSRLPIILITHGKSHPTPTLNLPDAEYLEAPCSTESLRNSFIY